MLNSVTTIINGMKIYYRKDNRLEGRIFLGDGNSKSFYGKTKSEIKNKAKIYLSKIENGYKESKKITLNAYIEYWLKNYKLNKIEPTSYSRLYSVYKNQIKNSLGNKNIGDITIIDIQHLIDVHANPIDKSTKPLAVSGLKKIVNLLNPCFKAAISEGIIQFNPCNGVNIPVESCVQTKTKEQICLSDDEIERFKNVALDKYKISGEYKSRNALILLIMLNLGLRVGEMQALEWKDVDFTNKIVHINKTMQNNIKDYEKSKVYTRIKKSTKTSSGIRVLKINDSTIFYFKELKEYDRRNNILCKYVTSSHANTIVRERNLQRSLDGIIEKAQIQERVSLHTLRHTFGSALIRKGIGIEVVSKLMGHANITITYKKYIHVLQEQQAIAMESVIVC